MKNIRMGIIGLGCRGYGLLSCVIAKMEGVTVTALCDIYEDRIEKAQAVLPNQAFHTTDYKQVLDREDVDAVLISCNWELHTPISIEAMKKGKTVACEVGGAVTLDECFQLVKTYEETKTPIMFMENCCYDKTETTVFNMNKDKLFGELVFLSGAYGHDLREEVANGKANRHYREKHYCERSCENYPTHELGPIAKLLNVTRGNRLVKLTSVASKAAGLNDYILRDKKHDDGIEVGKAKQGDVVVTLITCEDGSMIQLKLDTTLPRSYSRELTVCGTRGRYTQLYDEVFIDGDNEWKKSKGIDEYKSYKPEMWSDENEAKIKEAGHGGMDWLEFEDFFNCIRENKPFPIDVYDMATWMAVTPLSEISIKEGRAVDVPDFTNGKYKERK